jgi:penicillin-binding protein 1A
MSPQSAYVMVDLLKSTVEFGTLRWRRVNVGGFDGMPIAGKTGTTQNWGDAWTMGFSPYYTTAIWFGFDSPGNSLGRELTGATAAGPTWAEYMKKIHQGLDPRPFEKPETGLVNLRVCEVSGMLPTQYCPDSVEEMFIAGTEPKQFCDIHPFQRERDEELVRKLQDSFMVEDFDITLDDSGSSTEDFLGDMEFSADTGFDDFDPQRDMDLDGISTDDLEESGSTDRDDTGEDGETEDDGGSGEGSSSSTDTDGQEDEPGGSDGNVNPLLE